MKLVKTGFQMKTLLDPENINQKTLQEYDYDFCCWECIISLVLTLVT